MGQMKYILAKEPFLSVTTDMFGPLPETKRGIKYIIAVICPLFKSNKESHCGDCGTVI